MIGLGRPRGPAPGRSRRTRAPWRRWFPALAVLALLLLAPVFAFAQSGADSVRLAWTAPGDDDMVGTAAEYDLRISTAPIDAGNWDAATRVTTVPAPLPAGAAQSTMVRGLVQGTTYWFAIRTRDDAGNWSGISNVVRWDWVLDTAPPATPAGLAATRAGDDAELRWNAGAEPDLAGYHVYRSLSASGPFTRLNGAIVTSTQYTDTTVPAGTVSAWYAVTASDASGNESARSASAAVTFGSSAALATGWSLSTGYPNPARLDDVVRIPVVVGAGTGRLEVHDAAGRCVRRIPLDGLSPGAQEVTWDGRNDAGRAVAPGAFRVWVIAGGTRASMRLVRVP